VCFKGAVDEAIYTRSGVAATEENKELVWCIVFSWLQNRMITERMWCRAYFWLQMRNITLSPKTRSTGR